MKTTLYIAAAIALGMPALGVLAQAGTSESAQEVAAATPEDIARQGAILAQQMQGAIADRPANTSAADYEGILVFTVSQSTASDDVALDALSRIPVGDNANLGLAVNNVREAILAKRLRRGTAAIGNGGGQGGFGNGNGSFTNPSINTGGGSANYGQ